MDWLGSHSIAVVDPRLKDGYCGAVASELVIRSVPFIVYSGYGSGVAQDHPVFLKGTWLSKPSASEISFVAVDRLLA